MSSKFQVKQESTDDVEILSIIGFLDAHTAPILESKIDELVNDAKYKLIINFKGLEYISSAGLGVFMSQIETIRDNDGDLKLTEMQEKVFSVFDLLGFPMLFDVTENQEEAIKNFNKVQNDG